MVKLNHQIFITYYKIISYWPRGQSALIIIFNFDLFLFMSKWKGQCGEFLSKNAYSSRNVYLDPLCCHSFQFSRETMVSILKYSQFKYGFGYFFFNIVRVKLSFLEKIKIPNRWMFDPSMCLCMVMGLTPYINCIFQKYWWYALNQLWLLWGLIDLLPIAILLFLKHN